MKHAGVAMIPDLYRQTQGYIQGIRELSQSPEALHRPI